MLSSNPSLTWAQVFSPFHGVEDELKIAFGSAMPTFDSAGSFVEYIAVITSIPMLFQLPAGKLYVAIENPVTFATVKLFLS